MSSSHPPLPGTGAGPELTMDVSPEEAGLLRKERPGAGLAAMGLGGVLAVVALFLPWVSAGLVYNPSDDYVESPTEVGLFSAVDTVREVTDGARRAPDPGSVADLVFPWLLIALTLVAVVVTLGAALGLRRRTPTLLARIAALGLVGVAGLALAAGIWDIGAAFSDPAAGSGSATVSSDGERSESSIISRVFLMVGFPVWLGAMALLALAALLGPRIVHLIPEGGLTQRVLMRDGQPLPHGVPAKFADRVLRHRTTIAAAALYAVGALLVFAGYAFLPWGEDTSFNDIGEVARDDGFPGNVYSEAYFGWLGWVLLAVVVLCLVVAALGLKPLGINPRTARPLLVAAATLSLSAHVGMLLDLDAIGADLDVGIWATGIGFVLAALGALLPVTTRVRVVMTPPWGPQPPSGVTRSATGPQPPA